MNGSPLSGPERLPSARPSLRSAGTSRHEPNPAHALADRSTAADPPSARGPTGTG